MALVVYNTQSRTKEEFTPLQPNKVGMYVCGVTVYDFCHIGHARSQVVFDVVFRWLKHKGYDVTYVRNFTDVDDKIIARANERGVPTTELAQQYIDEFYTDMNELGIQSPTVEPRATEHIEQIIEVVKKLEHNGLAYNAGGDVYYAVRKFEGYGKLSRRDIDEMRSGARVDVDERKQDPLDFALWKNSKPGEPTWNSPWGEGRPGWHIECSAMSNHHLGASFDIHGGGQDLVFPHHENEIAQSEGATGEPFVKYWIHNGFVQVNHEKMSKSLGNFFTIRDVLKTIPPDVLRFFLMAVHYRHPLDYYDEALNEAREAVDRVFTALETLDANLPKEVELDEAQLTGKQKGQLPALRQAVDGFTAAMDDDFNSPRAIGYMFELVTLVNTIATKGKLQDEPGKSMLLTEAKKAFDTIRDVLGFPIVGTAEYRRRSAEIAMAKHGITEADIEAKIVARNQARAAKDWATADKIRGELEAWGLSIKDGPEGTTWYAK
ncbi:MAG: cysteine--tRNA ligase [Candidatus Lernaella stagnicola]|nr:cysteine--tRNA ligase [Candidatus Lernaella stagnicola]